MLLFQRFVELVECQDVEPRERNLFQMVEVAILGYDIVGSGCNGAVYKLVVVLVDVAKQVKAEEGFAIND